MLVGDNNVRGVDGGARADAEVGEEPRRRCWPEGPPHEEEGEETTVARHKEGERCGRACGNGTCRRLLGGEELLAWLGTARADVTDPSAARIPMIKELTTINTRMDSHDQRLAWLEDDQGGHTTSNQEINPCQETSPTTGGGSTLGTSAIPRVAALPQ